MNALRNLYKITNASGNLIAHITATDANKALAKYLEVGGTDHEGGKVEAISHGYDQEICAIY